MKNRNTIVMCMLVFLMFNIKNAFGQSAWTKSKGELFSQVSYTFIPNYNEIFSNGTYITSREITDNTLQFYGEYGITDNLTLIANIPIKAIRTGDAVPNSTVPLTINEASKTALGNIQVGLKQKLYNGKFLLSGQLNIEANTGRFYNGSGIRTGYDAWTFTPTLNVGRGYTDFYYQAFTGVDVRTNNYSSNFKIGGEFGFTSIKNTTLVAFLDIVKSFENGDVVLPATSIETALYINNQDYSAFGLKGLYDISDDYGFSLGLGAAISANNVAKQLAISAGFFYKLN